MSEQEKKQETSTTPRPNTDNKKQSAELSEEELKKVTGGNITIAMRKAGGDPS